MTSTVFLQNKKWRDLNQFWGVYPNVIEACMRSFGPRYKESVCNAFRTRQKEEWG